MTVLSCFDEQEFAMGGLLGRAIHDVTDFVLPMPEFIAAAASPRSVTVPYFDGLDFGVGVDTPSGTALNVAVSGDPTQIPNATGQYYSYYMNEVTSEEDLQTALGISAEANGGIGLFKASASLSFAQSCNFNTSSVFAIISIRITNAFTMVKAPTISPTALALLTAGDNEGFRRQFGDMFVRGLETGGSFFGIIQIQTSSEADKNSMSAKLAAAYGPFGASGSFSDDFKNAVTNRNIQVRMQSAGGTIPTAVTTSLDTLVGAASAWPASVATKAVVFSALLDDYGTLATPNPPNFVNLQQQHDVLTRCSILRNADLTTLNDINFIRANASQFRDLDTVKLAAVENQIGQDLNTIATAASAAANDPLKAAFPALVLPPPVELPQRITEPIVTGIEPITGAMVGGDRVTIFGSGFTGATSVNFGGQAAADLTTTSDTELTVSSPAQSSTGSVDVTVTTSAGTSAATIVDHFTYAAPPLGVKTVALPAATCGTSYTAQLENAGGVPPLTWSVASGTLPDGLSITTSGKISGIPPQQDEPGAVVFAVTDAGGDRALSVDLVIHLRGRVIQFSAPLIQVSNDHSGPFTVESPAGTSIDASTVSVAVAGTPLVRPSIVDLAVADTQLVFSVQFPGGVLGHGLPMSAEVSVGFTCVTN